MIYLEKVKIISTSYPGSHVFDKGDEFLFEDVNLFVGNQGCGKSTLLNLIQQNHKDLKLFLSDFAELNGVSTFFFDSEKDNPRTKDLQLFTTPSGGDVGIGYGNALMSHFKSHGEILEKFIIKPILEAKNCVILLDEPESGLSLTNQFKMIKAIKIAVNNGCQFFIATHCYPLIKEFNVISLEHNKKRMSGKDFINLIKNSL